MLKLKMLEYTDGIMCVSTPAAGTEFGLSSGASEYGVADCASARFY